MLDVLFWGWSFDVLYWGLGISNFFYQKRKKSSVLLQFLVIKTVNPFPDPEPDPYPIEILDPDPIRIQWIRIHNTGKRLKKLGFPKEDVLTLSIEIELQYFSSDEANTCMQKWVDELTWMVRLGCVLREARVACTCDAWNNKSLL